MHRAATYTQHFGLAEAPFSARPDPRFFYQSHGHNNAWTKVVRGIRGRPGFVVMTGGVGTGKTTLLRRLVDKVADGTRVILLSDAALTSDRLLRVLCEALGLPVEGHGRVATFQMLNDFLLAQARRGSHLVLLVDEAQDLHPEVLEHLRLMTRLPIVLAGRPELRARLDDLRLRGVSERIEIRYELAPLRKAEIHPYVRHRLQVAGRRTSVFTLGAIRRIASYTLGIPLLVNILCHTGLLLAFADGAKMVSARMIDDAAADLIAIAARSAHP